MIITELIPIKEQLERIEKKLDGNFKNKFLSINEVRKRENLNSIPNGDEHLIPLNLASLDSEDNAV